MSVKMIAFTSVLVLSSAVNAQTQPDPAAVKAPATSKSNKVVCRTDNEMGSMIRKKKICMTVAEWRDVNRQSGEWLEKRTQDLGKPGGG